MDVPQHVVRMLRRTRPSACMIPPGTTPVVAFGDPRRAEVATLGINPSWGEFFDGDVLLTGSSRRLADAVSLGIERFEDVTDAQVEQIASDCFGYFDRPGARPYWKWFRPLEKLLAYTGQGWSYPQRSACHLDLVQWTTKPVWKDLPSSVKKALLDDGVPHLRAQLQHDNIRVVLLNGITVIKQVEAVGLVGLEPAGTMAYGATRHTDLYRGVSEGVLVLGWSVNVQGTPGANADAFLSRLGTWVGEQAELKPVVVADPAGHVPRDPLHGLHELVEVLGRWARDTTAPTIGDAGSFGGRPWVTVDIPPHQLVINADTKRSAVEELLRLYREDSVVLQVVANARGKVNKVVLRPGGEATPGWFCYTTSALEAPARL